MSDGNSFQEGEVWESPRGKFYKVISVQPGQATLRSGMHGDGRKNRRRPDAVQGWLRWSSDDVKSYLAKWRSA